MFTQVKFNFEVGDRVKLWRVDGYTGTIMGRDGYEGELPWYAVELDAGILAGDGTNRVYPVREDNLSKSHKEHIVMGIKVVETDEETDVYLNKHKGSLEPIHNRMFARVYPSTYVFVRLVEIL